MSGRVRLARFEMTLDSYRRASGEGNKTDILLQHSRHLPRTLFVNSGGTCAVIRLTETWQLTVAQRRKPDLRIRRTRSLLSNALVALMHEPQRGIIQRVNGT
jgi:hypothetical protein